MSELTEKEKQHNGQRDRVINWMLDKGGCRLREVTFGNSDRTTGRVEWWSLNGVVFMFHWYDTSVPGFDVYSGPEDCPNTMDGIFEFMADRANLDEEEN